MSFSEALEFCRNGGKIARAGWNGAKLGVKAFVVCQKGYPDGVPLNANSAEALSMPEGTMVAFEPYLMLAVVLPEGDERRGPNDCQMLCRPWTPDQRDVLAKDWCEVE